MLRHVGKIAVIVLLMGAGAVALAALRAVSPDRLAARIEGILGQVFGAPVKVAHAQLGFNGVLHADEITAEVPGRPGWTITIPHASAGVPLDMVLGKDVGLAYIIVDRAEVVLRADLAQPPGKQVRLPALKPPGGPPPGKVTLRELAVALDAPREGGDLRAQVKVRDLDVLMFISAVPTTPLGLRTKMLPLPMTVAAARGALAAEAEVKRGEIQYQGDEVSLRRLALESGGITWEPSIHLSGPAHAREIEARLLPTTLPAAQLARGLAALAGIVDQAAVAGAVTTGTVEVTAVASGPLGKPELAGELRLTAVGVKLPGELGRLEVKSGSLIATPDAKGVLVTPQKMLMTLTGGGPARALVLEKGDLVLGADAVKLHDLTLRAVPGDVPPSTGAGGPPGPKLELKGDVIRGEVGARAELEVRCDRADLRALAALVDAKLAEQMGKLDARLTGDVALSVRGPLAAPEIRGPIALGEGSLKLGADAKAPVAEVKGGKLELEGRTARLSGVKLAVRGLPVDVTGSMSAVGPKLDLALATTDAPVREVLALFDADAELTQRLSGTFAKVSLKLAGAPGSAPSVVLALAGVRLAWPGLKEPATATAGEASIAGGKLVLSGVKLELARGSAELAGTIELATKKLDLALNGRPLPAELLAGALPPGMALSGAARADLRITGTRAAPQVAGTVAVDGLTARWPGLARDLTATKGTVELAAGKIALRGVELTAGADRVKIDGELARGASLTARKIGVEGTIELGHLAWPEGLAVKGPARLEARVSGDLAEPRIAGRISAKSARMTRADKPLDLTDLDAELAVEDGEVRVPKFRAKAMGAAFEGSVDGDGQFALRGDGLALKTLLAGGQSALWKEGTLSFAVKGNSGPTLAELELDGNVAIEGLVMDMSSSKKLKSLKARATAGETGSALATGLLSATGLSILAGASAAQAHFFAEVLDEALDVHAMGRVASPLSVRDGRLELAALSGPNVKGRVGARLDSGQLEGKLEFIQFGQARFLDVAMAGTLSDPEPSVSATGVRLGGKGPPGGKNGGQGALNLKTLVKPVGGLLFGPVVPVADLLLPKLFGRKKRRRPKPSPSPSPAASPEPD